MSWTWNLAPIIGANAVDQRPNPFAMARTREPIFRLWKLKLKKKRKWLGVDVSTAKSHLFATGLIPVLNPQNEVCFVRRPFHNEGAIKYTYIKLA